jgi:hypothetical protein
MMTLQFRGHGLSSFIAEGVRKQSYLLYMIPSRHEQAYENQTFSSHGYGEAFNQIQQYRSCFYAAISYLNAASLSIRVRLLYGKGLRVGFIMRLIVRVAIPIRAVLTLRASG